MLLHITNAFSKYTWQKFSITGEKNVWKLILYQLISAYTLHNLQMVMGYKEDLEYMITKLILVYNECRFRGNIDKNKYLCSIVTALDNLHLENVRIISSCSSFKYLESTFNTQWIYNEEIQNKIIMVRKAIDCRNRIL